MTDPARPSAPTRGARDIVGFLLFSHGWTWLFWGISGSMGRSVWEQPATSFFVIGGAGVFLGGIVMSRWTGGMEGLRDLTRRIFDPRRVPLAWWALILLLYPALTVLAAAFHAAAGGAAPALDLHGAADRLGDPLGLLAMAGFILVIGPLPEEIGWRGYLLDRLQLRWSALTASLVLGIVWWSWHLPLFVLPGYFEAFGRATPSPLAFLYGILPAAIVYTWVYNGTDRSVFAVIVLHFMQNFTGEFLGLAEEARSVRSVLEVVLAVAVIAWAGPATLRRGRPVPAPPGAADRHTPAPG
jgi:uncharacterized protein